MASGTSEARNQARRRQLTRLWLGAAAVVALIAVYATALYPRPTIRLATHEQMIAVAPPALLDRPTQDRAALARYADLAEVTNILKDPSRNLPSLHFFDPKVKAEAQRELPADMPVIQAACHIVDGGPIEKPYNDNPFDENLDFSGLKKLAKGLAFAADTYGETRHLARCRWAVIENLKLSRAIRNPGQSVVTYFISEAVAQIAENAAISAARQGWLDRSSMTTALKLIPSTGPVDHNLPGVYAGEFFRSVAMLDSLARNEAAHPEEGLGDQVGNFDALDAARFDARYLALARADVEKDWTQRDSGETEMLRQRTSNLPPDPDPDSQRNAFPEDDDSDQSNKPKPSLWSRFLYRIRMNRIDDSIGRWLCLPFDCSNLRLSVEVGAERRELKRTVLATRLYMSLHAGSLPRNLQALVTSRLLGSMPMDWFTGQPLRYDPHRRIVWSACQDGIDNGGRFKNEMSGSEPDLGIFIDEPKPEIPNRPKNAPAGPPGMSGMPGMPMPGMPSKPDAQPF